MIVFSPTGHLQWSLGMYNLLSRFPMLSLAIFPYFNTPYVAISNVDILFFRYLPHCPICQFLPIVMLSMVEDVGDLAIAAIFVVLEPENDLVKVSLSLSAYRTVASMYYKLMLFFDNQCTPCLASKTMVTTMNTGPYDTD
eukprot:PhF_6_TR12440/c0_g1_i1/m.19596